MAWVNPHGVVFTSFSEYQADMKRRMSDPNYGKASTNPPILEQGASDPQQRSAADAAHAARAQEKAFFSGWSNIAAVRALQEEWWDIYVATGERNTVRQQQLNQMAQDIREATNPMYDRDALPFGPATPGQAGKIALPDVETGLMSLSANVLPIAAVGFLLLLLKRR